MILFVSFCGVIMYNYNQSAMEKLSMIMNKIEGAYSPDTIRAYNVDFIAFISFCEQNANAALPAESITVANYIELLINKDWRSASIRRAVAGISSIHNLAGEKDPTKEIDTRLALKRMHRKLGRFSRQAYALNKPLIDELIAGITLDLRGIRDKALLLVAYDSMCRRSELIHLKIEDIRAVQSSDENNKDTLAILLRRSKTDQEANGRWIRLSPDTSLALKYWLGASQLTEGPIFRGVWRGNHITEKLVPGQISRIYKRLAKNAKIDPQVVKKISGHSTRVGAAQDLVISGASMPVLLQKGRWSKTDTVMRYVENIGHPI